MFLAWFGGNPESMFLIGIIFLCEKISLTTLSPSVLLELWLISIGLCTFILKIINQKNRLYLNYMDLTDYSSVYECLKQVKPDFIFHLAAQSFPKASFNLREITYNTNILGTDRLLHSVLSLKLNPIIHICSSSEVFGRVKKKRSAYK